MAGITPHPRRTLAIASGAFGVTLLGFATSPNYIWFVVASVPVGVASACFTAANTAVLQRATDPAMLKLAAELLDLETVATLATPQPSL